MASVTATAAGGWRVSVYKLGVRDTKSFPAGTTKTEAGQWGTLREAAIIADAAAEKKAEQNRTVQEVIEGWAKAKLPGRDNQAWEGARCRWFVANLPFLDTVARELDHEDIEEWIAERQRIVTGDSINRDLQLLGPIFKWGVKKKWMSTNPLEGVEKPQNSAPRDVQITDADAQAIVDALGYVRGHTPITRADRLAVAFLLALETGMRRGELLKTEWRHVHDSHIHLPAGICKNRHKRDVPLSVEAHCLIGLLPRHDGLMLDGLTADAANELFRDARTRACRPGLHFHDTRHEAVTRLARKLPLLALARMIGHRDLNSLKTYYNETPQEMAAMLRRADAPPPPPSDE